MRQFRRKSYFLLFISSFAAAAYTGYKSVICLKNRIVFFRSLLSSFSFCAETVWRSVINTLLCVREQRLFITECGDYQVYAGDCGHCCHDDGSRGIPVRSGSDAGSDHSAADVIKSMHYYAGDDRAREQGKYAEHTAGKECVAHLEQRSGNGSARQDIERMQ